MFGNIFQQKENIKKELDDIQFLSQGLGYKPRIMDKAIKLLNKLHDIISKEEEYWKQRSRVVWLKSGDKNTKFFHMTTMKHRATNRIKKL